MAGFWQPPSKTDTKPKRRLWAENGMDGTELPQPHIMSSPPGTRAPVDRINYTPKTNQVHAPGVPAPENELNYTLLPHDYMSSVGAGADAPPASGMMPGQGGITARYGTNANQRANTFSPGQPPLSPYPYGTGPGPQLQASGPAERPFGERGTSMGNASTFGQERGSFMSGPIGAGQEGRARSDPTQPGGWTGLPEDEAPGVADPTPVAPTPSTQEGPAPVAGRAGSANAPAALPSIPGWRLITTKDPSGAPYEVFYEPEPPDPTKKPIPVGIYTRDPVTQVVSLNRHPQFTVEQILGLPGAADTMQVVTLQGPDGVPHEFVVDKKDPSKKIDLGPAGEKPVQPPKKTPGEEVIAGEGQGARVSIVQPDGTLKPDAARTAEVRAEAARAEKAKLDAEGRKEESAADRSAEQALIQAETTLATADMFSTFTDAQGQTWLMNNNTGARQKVGKADLAKGTMTVDGSVIRLNEDGPADVLYKSPENRTVDTINGQTVEYDPKDPKGTWKVITEDEYYKPTKEQALEKGRLDMEKIRSDMEAGKITNAEARIKMAEAAYKIEHPEPTAFGSHGDFYLPAGGNLDVHYESGVKRFGGKKLSAGRQKLVDMYNREIEGLTPGAKPAAAATTPGGTATTPAAAATGDGAKPAEEKPSDETGKPQPYGWERADQELGRTPAGDVMAPEAGKTGTVAADDPRRIGRAATPEEIEAARAGWTPPGEEAGGVEEAGESKNPNWEGLPEAMAALARQLSPEEEEEAGAGQDRETYMGRGLSPAMGRGSTGAGWEPRQGFQGSSSYEQSPLYDRTLSNYQQDVSAMSGAGQEAAPQGWQPQQPAGPVTGTGVQSVLADLKGLNQRLMQQANEAEQQPEQPQTAGMGMGQDVNDEPYDASAERRAAGLGKGGLAPSYMPPISKWDDIIREHAGEYEDDPRFVRTVAAGARAESSDDPNAYQIGYKADDPRTHAKFGGRGLWQFDINKGAMGHGVPEEQLFDPAYQASRIVPEYAREYGKALASKKPPANDAELASLVAGSAERPFEWDKPGSAARRNYAKAYGELGAGQGEEMGGMPGIPPDIAALGTPPGGVPPSPPGGMPGGPVGGPPGAPPGWQPPVPPPDVAGIGHRFGQPMNEGEPVHSGVDLQATEGTPTIAPADGIVEDVRNDPAGLGLTVIVRDKDGNQHKLGHLESTRAYRGMVVGKGQNLARVGSSGNTTGSHLHWAVKDQTGQPQDPTAALGPMASLPPVPGTEMMGPPGGTGSPPGAAAGPPPGAAPPGAPPAPGGLPEGIPSDIESLRKPPGMGNDSMGAGADDDDAGDLGITPGQQAEVDATNKATEQRAEQARMENERRKEEEANRHSEKLMEIEQAWKIHQDDDRRQQEINAETARHNQAAEQIEYARIAMDKEIQQMRDANAIKLQQMQNGNAIYLQQGDQAFKDWQQNQKMKMDILGSALKNPWLQRLSGMTPGPGYQGGAVGGQNISALISQITQPYDPKAWGAQNAPESAGLGNQGATAGGGPAGPPPAPGPAIFQQQPQAFQQAQGWGQQAPQQYASEQYGWTPTQQKPPPQQAGQPGEIGPMNEAFGGGNDMGAGQAAPGAPPLYQQPTWQQWRGWDPFQRAAFRTDVEAIGPGAWEEAGQNMAESFAGQGGNERVTKMQAAGSGEPGRAGMEMTADVFGKAPQQFWQEQNRGWSQAAAPRVKQNLEGSQLQQQRY